MIIPLVKICTESDMQTLLFNITITLLKPESMQKNIDPCFYLFLQVFSINKYYKLIFLLVVDFMQALYFIETRSSEQSEIKILVTI